MTNPPSTQDRFWAVIAHLSALVMGMGIVLPIVGWSEQRGKSKYASFQCLQALGYQSLGYTVWILSTLIILIVVAVGAVAGIANVENLEENMLALMFAQTSFIVALIGIYFILPIIASIACALGRDFRYPIMGYRLARYVGYDAVSSGESLIEEHEERWVASMGHFAVIIMLWGMLAPAATWMLQGRRSPFLKFQSIQALVFQAGTLLLFASTIVFYLGGSFFFLLSMGFSGEPNFNSTDRMMGMVVLLVSMLCASAIVLIVPLLHIMGQWAGYRVLKGDDYRYPLVGRWVERFIERQ